VPLLGEPLGPGLVAAIAVTAFCAWWGGRAARVAENLFPHALR
jgi:hypothetical protein